MFGPIFSARLLIACLFVCFSQATVVEYTHYTYPPCLPDNIRVKNPQNLTIAGESVPVYLGNLGDDVGGFMQAVTHVLRILLTEGMGINSEFMSVKVGGSVSLMYAIAGCMDNACDTFTDKKYPPAMAFPNVWPDTAAGWHTNLQTSKAVVNGAKLFSPENIGGIGFVGTMYYAIGKSTIDQARADDFIIDNWYSWRNPKAASYFTHPADLAAAFPAIYPKGHKLCHSDKSKNIHTGVAESLFAQGFCYDTRVVARGTTGRIVLSVT